MTTLSDLDASARDLFLELNRTTEGRQEAQVSMYTIGETIGLDREASAAAAEDLMASGLVEIRTLSGAIGLSAQGADLVKAGGEEERDVLRLGSEPLLAAPQSDLVESILADIKSEMGQSGLAYEALAEMIADIRTIEAQLASPKPKTTIVRACFTSMLDTAREARQEKWRNVMETLMG